VSPLTGAGYRCIHAFVILPGKDGVSERPTRLGPRFGGVTVDSGNRELSIGTVVQLALTARLDLSAERAEVVRGTIEHFYAVMDKMDDLDVSDVSPAATFSPLWT
jgi:hypothetical protein